MGRKKYRPKLNPKLKVTQLNDYIAVTTHRGYCVLLDSVHDLNILNDGYGWIHMSDMRMGVEAKSKHRKLMHRVLMNAKPGQIVDHVNGNSLDNRRNNLRFCTHAENMCNRRAEKVGRKKIQDHGFKGIIKNGKKNLAKPWIALIAKASKQYYSSYYATPEEAAKAYDELALKLHGEFARLNFPVKRK